MKEFAQEPLSNKIFKSSEFSYVFIMKVPIIALDFRIKNYSLLYSTILF